MNENLQSAGPMDQVHPDADQLTAFAEQALPLHEREQTLAHLAECAGCRQIVFLAQQAAEDEAVAAEPVRVRRPWFAGWNLVWPALIAVAGMVAFSVHLRNVGGNVAKPVVAVGGSTTEAAVVEPQPPAPVAPPVVAPVAPKPLGIAAMKAKAAPAPMIAGRLGAVPVDAGANVAGSAEEPKSVALAEARPTAATSQMLGGIGGAGSAGAPVAMGAPAMAKRNAARSGPAAQQMQQMQPVQNGSVATTDQAASTGQVAQQPRVRARAPAFSAGAVASAAAPAPPPPPAPKPAPVAAAPPSAAQTVTVQAASATLATENASSMSNESISRMSALTTPELPSHLGAESTATSGKVALALDSGGSLFFSKSPGGPWKQVKMQWTGRAVKVEATAGSGAAFALTTDAGATWVSSDGQHWKRR